LSTQDYWTKKVAEWIRNSALHVASDGSFAEGIGTAAWILFEKNILDEGISN